MDSLRPHLLLLEDDEDTLRATMGVLEHLGCEVTPERESLGALRAFSERPECFDVALLKHPMHGITGLELAERFRRIRKGFPVVLFEGELKIPSAEEQEGADGIMVVRNPAAMPELAKALRLALSQHNKASPFSS